MVKPVWKNMVRIIDVLSICWYLSRFTNKRRFVLHNLNVLQLQLNQSAD